MPTRSYKDITKALTVLAFWGGNYSAAVKELHADGMSIVTETLKGWATSKYQEDYERIRESFREKYEEEIVSSMRDIIRDASEVEKLAIKQTKDNILAEPAKNAAQSAYYLSQVKKNNVEKLQSMTGRPTHIIEDRTPEAALRSLVQRGILKPVGNETQPPNLKLVENEGEDR